MRRSGCDAVKEREAYAGKSVEKAHRVERWSSSEIVAPERRAFWVDVVCRTLVNLRCEPGPQPFNKIFDRGVVHTRIVVLLRSSAKYEGVLA
jgi:hypothetical protein